MGEIQNLAGTLFLFVFIFLMFGTISVDVAEMNCPDFALPSFAGEVKVNEEILEKYRQFLRREYRKRRTAYNYYIFTKLFLQWTNKPVEKITKEDNQESTKATISTQDCGSILLGYPIDV